MITSCNTIWYEIDRQLMLVREGLFIRYPKALAVCRSKDDKARIINHGLFSDIVEYMAQLEHLVEELDLYVTDIDKSGFTLQRLTTMLAYYVEARNKERTI